MDAAITYALALVVRLAEKEDGAERTPESAQLVSDMRRAAADADDYALKARAGRCPCCGRRP